MALDTSRVRRKQMNCNACPKPIDPNELVARTPGNVYHLEPNCLALIPGTVCVILRASDPRVESAEVEEALLEAAQKINGSKG